MERWIRWGSLGLMAVVALMSASCGYPSLEDPKLSTADFALEEFFDGRTVAYGQFNDRFGTARRRFKVEIDGSWDGKTLQLIEDFTYADATQEQRIWKLQKSGPDVSDQLWVGRAAGVQGEAEGREVGDVFNWRYTIDLTTPDGSALRVDFDDWMWLMEDGRLLNIAYMSRFGVDLGEVVIFFEKRD